MAEAIERARGADGRFLPASGAKGTAAAKRKAGVAKGRRGGGRAKAADGWTPEKEEIFFRELAMVCNIAAALRAAGLSRHSSSLYRRKREPEFRAAWNEAIAESYEQLELEMLERSRNRGKRPPPKTEAERRLREVPDALALQLLKLHRAEANRVRSVAQRPFRGEELRQQLERRLSEINRRLGGLG